MVPTDRHAAGHGVRAHRGESHGDERWDKDVPAGPQQSGERSVAGLAACPREQTDQSPGGNRADDEPTVTFAPRPTPAPTEPTTPMSPVETALRARIDALDLAPCTDLTAAHPAVLRTAVHLKHLKSRDLTWPRGTRSGPIIEVRNVSEAQQERALKVLDALLRGAESLGWPFESPPRAEPEPRRNAWTSADTVHHGRGSA